MTDYTVAMWQANQSTYDAGPAFGIDDIAANISSALDALNADSHIAEIIVSDNNPVVVTVAQLSSDAASLSILVNANSTAATLTVTDTAANISNGFLSIAADSQVSSIVISDSPAHTVSLTAAEFVNDGTTVAELREADGTTPATVNVLDTAANLSANIDALESHVSEINQIIVSDSQPITLTAAQVSNDAAALHLVENHNGGGVVFDVRDTGTNISAHLDALEANSDINQITVLDNAAVTASVAQISSDASVLSELQNANSSSVILHVLDTAADIQASLSSLNADSAISSIIISDNNAISISIAQLNADSTALGKLQNANLSSYSLLVSDTAANIGISLGTLNSNTHVSSIVVTNNAPISVNVAEISADATALGKVVDRNGSAYTLTVTDTASNVSTAFDSLSGNSHVTKIVVSDSGSNEVTINAAQAAADGTALGELFLANGITAAHVEVSDMAVNISTAFDTLSGNSHVDKIVVSDSAANEVTITAAQAAADSVALGELFLANGTTPAHVAVSDTATKISTAFDALSSNSHVDKIVVNNGPANEVVVNVAQLTSDATAIGELFQSDGTTAAHVAVSDTAANISSAFDALSSNSHVDKIVVNNGPANEVTITAAQAAADSTALGELFQSDGATAAHVAVSDTAANISTAFDALDGNTHVDKIVVSDSASNEVVVNVAQLTSDAAAIGELFLADGVTAAHVAVSDTAANISTAFDALDGNTHVDKIVVSDSASNEVTITAAQAGADGTALGELFLANGTTAAMVAVSDTASNISTAFDALDGNTHVDKIVVNNGPANEVVVNVAQLTSDATAIGELFQSDGTTAAHVAVSDTAANISSAFDALSSNSHVDKIVVNNGPANEVVVNVAQLTSDATAIGELFQSDGTTAAHVAVSDTAANISSAFDALSNNTHVDKIVISDANEVTITAAQAAADSTALGELFLTDGTTAAHVEVSDTAANIANALGALNSNTHVDKIVVSDSASNEVTITAAQAAADSTALGELFLVGGTTAAHVEVFDTAANIANALGALNSNTHVDKIVVSNSASNEVTITAAQAGADGAALGELFLANGTTAAMVAVSDTASNISTAFDALDGNAHVNKIVVSNSATHEVTITAAQAAADSAALGEIFQANGISHADVEVSDSATNIITALAALNSNAHVNKIVINDGGTVVVSVAQLSSDATAIGELLLANGTTAAHVEVSDTAANISAAFDALSGNTHVGEIVVSDSGSNGVTITAAQAGSDGKALGELFQADGTTPLQVEVSDTAANISAVFGALNSNTHVDKIVVSDSASNEVTITAAQAAADGTALGELVQSDGTTTAMIAVSDTAANISTVFDSLDGTTQINKIIVSDSAANEVTITAAQAAADGTALGELFQANGISHADVEVSDMAANITSALASLNANTQVNKIVVSDSATNEVVVNVAQLTSDATALTELFKADGTTQATVEISDTAANIQAALATLNGNAQVDKIVVSDSATHEVVVNVAQLTTDATAIGELFQADGTTAAHVVEVSDTAANITAAFDALSSNARVGKIVVNDSNGVTITAAQAASDGAALGELFQADGVTALQVEVSDTAANISAALGALNANTHVGKIVVSDSATNEVRLNIAQFTSDSIALGELFQANGTAQANVAISDTSADIAAALNVLNGASQVDSITVSNNTALTISVSQLVNDTTALGELHYKSGSPVMLSILDSTANVHAHLGVLEADVASIRSISFTNAGTPTLSVTQTQATNDASVIAKITGAYDLHVTNVTGQSYGSYTNFYNASNDLTLTTQFNTDGSVTDIAHTSGLTMSGTNQSDTFDIVAGHSDTILSGKGADTFEFTSVSESTSTNYDTIAAFNANVDKFDFSALGLHVTGIDATVKGALSASSFDANLTTVLDAAHLSAGHAVLFTVTSGSLMGDTFLVVDANGHAGYQAGHDFVFLLTGPTHLSGLSTGDFV